MEIKIFNVEHGFCAYIIADNRNVMLVDCGHNSNTDFRPSDYLIATGCSGIEWFVVSNYDEDHLSDLPQLRHRFPIQSLWRNQSIDADELRGLKLEAGPLRPGITTLLDMVSTFTDDVYIHTAPKLEGVDISFFQNPHPLFRDTNNLSKVTFLHSRGINIVFPGDLEKPGWKELLKNPSFRNKLEKVNLFVASHHGRESGYCSEVFDYCDPDLVIISDEAIKYETQEVDYRKHTTGIRWEDGSNKYVLTTRKNGMISITEKPGVNYYILTEH